MGAEYVNSEVKTHHAVSEEIRSLGHVIYSDCPLKLRRSLPPQKAVTTGASSDESKKGELI